MACSGKKASLLFFISSIIKFIISHILVQIVDARNPMLFQCDDLRTYALEIDSSKKNLLLINKSDFLTFEQR